MTTIDERVVAMRFDNNKFQSNVGDTLKSLDDLKKGLNFDGAKKGLSDLQAASGKVNLNGISSGIDNLASKFEGLKAIGLGALAAIGAKVTELGINFARDLVGNMTQAARDGFGEYETQINGIQTIMANTASKGTTMQDVNKALQELNIYADKTIYNFAEMTRNIGTFTAAGVDLETSTAAIKGIANLAAVSGSSSQQAATAMYQLSQALASGTVKLMDWNSVVNAGMGGQVFQDALKETARAQGIAVDAMIEKNGSFRESLQEGWLTSAVLTETLSKFTGDLSEEQIRNMGYTKAQAKEIMALGELANDAATKVKTFSQLMETLAEASGSGWAQSWQIVLGDFEEAKALFTEISDVIGGLIGESAAARNEQLQIWKDAGGREAVIQGLRNAFEALMKIVNPIREAFRDVFPPTLGNTLAKLSFAFRDFTAGLIISDDAAKGLKTVATQLFQGIKIGVDILGGVFGLIGNGISIVWNLASALVGLISPVVKFVASLFPVQKSVEGTTDGIDKFFNMLKQVQNFIAGPIIGWLKSLGDGFDNAINGGELAARVRVIIDALQAFGAAARSVFNILFKGDFTGNPLFQEDSPLANALFRIRDAFMSLKNGFIPFIKNLAENVKNAFSGISDGLGEGFKNIDWNTVLAWVNTGLLATFGIMLSKGLSSITSIFKGTAGLIGTFSKGLEDALGGLTGILESMQTKIKADALLKIAIGIGVLAAALAVLAMIEPERLISSVTAMAVAFGILLGGLAILDKINAAPSIKASVALTMIATAINILSLAVARMSSLDPWELVRGLTGIAVAMGILVGAAKLMSGFEKDIVRTSAAMILMATAITILAGAVTAFGFLPLDVLVQGGIAVVTMLAALTGAAVILSKFAPQMITSSVGLMAMAAAINMLVIPITALGFLPFAVLAQGLSTLGVMLLGLTIVAQQLSKEAPKMLASAVGLVAMAAALNLLIAPIITLGLLPWPVLVQGLMGLAGAMAVLVIAAKALEGAKAGVAGMIVLASAIFILSTALAVLGSMSLEQIGVALLALAGAFVIIGVAAAVLSPILPVITGLGAALALMGLGMLALSATIAVFAIGLTLLGPALAIVGAGLLALAAVMPKVAEQTLAFVAVGVGLLAFGAGAAVAAIGVGLLGAALVIMGAGLAIIGAVGIVGATALIATVNALLTLMPHAGEIAILGASFLALGAGLTLVGAGAVLAGAGLLLIASGMAILAAIGIPTIVAFANAMITLLPAAMTALAQGVANFVTTLLNAAPQIVAAAVKAFQSLLEGIRSTIPDIVATGVAAIQGLLDGIRQVIPDIVDTILVLVEEILRLLVEAVPKMVDAGLKIITGVLDGIASNIQGVVTAAMRIITEFLTGIEKNIGKVITKGTDVIIAFIKGIGENAVRLANAAADTIVDFIRGLEQAVKTHSKRISDAGWDLAEAIISGMVNGIGDGIGRIIGAAQNMAQNALDAAMNLLGIHSPSKEFEKIGKFVNQGFAKGIMGSRDEVQAAYITMKELLKDARKNAQEEIDKINAKIKTLRESRKEDKETLKDLEKERAKRKKEGKDTDALDKRIKKLKKTREKEAKAINEQKKALEAARKEKRLSEKAYDKLTGKVKEDIKAQKELAKAYEETDAKVKDAQKVLEDAIKTRNDYNAGVKDQYSALDDIDAETKLDEYTNNLKKRITDTLEFTARIQELRDMGLNDKLYKELIGKGIDALPFVEQLLSTGAQGVTDLNKLSDTLDEAAGELGNNASKELYQAGVDAARGIRDGLRAERAAIKEEMEEIAKSMTDAIKKALGIKSPSKEFAKIGKFADQGLVKGLKDAASSVEKASEDVGNKALNTLKKSLTDISSAVASDIDINPSIRPVLDLSAIKKDSGLIGGLLKPPSLNVDGTYAHASSAYSAYKAGRLFDEESAASAAAAAQGVTFIQNNNSPKALSESEIYRQTKNQLSVAKGALTK